MQIDAMLMRRALHFCVKAHFALQLLNNRFLLVKYSALPNVK